MAFDGKTDDYYSAVGYVYDTNTNPTGPTFGPEPKRINDSLPFVLPTDLHIPPDIKLPKTMKSHAIIEKTAKFIAEQGNQMEIIVKAKQANNPQFDFLGYNDPLNPYYKYLVQVIKTGNYKPVELHFEDQTFAPSHGDTDLAESKEDADDNYLHPSLYRKDSGKIPIVFPTYKPTGTGGSTKYSILVSKMKEVASHDNQQAQLNVESLPAPNEGTNNVARVEFTPTGIPIRQPHEIPNPQDQLVIEKMANYVLKNGPAFESLAKTKGDPRFTFLDTRHAFHWYYLNCKERFRAEYKAVVATGSFISYRAGKIEPEITETYTNNYSSDGDPSSSLFLSAPGSIPKDNNYTRIGSGYVAEAEDVSTVGGLLEEDTLFEPKVEPLDYGMLPWDSSISSICDMTSESVQKMSKQEKMASTFLFVNPQGVGNSTEEKQSSNIYDDKTSITDLSPD